MLMLKIKNTDLTKLVNIKYHHKKNYLRSPMTAPAELLLWGHTPTADKLISSKKALSQKALVHNITHVH